MKVTTKDFQILQGTNTFEFPVGITVIQGKTGSGKTTLFYAIEDCLINPSGYLTVTVLSKITISSSKNLQYTLN